MLKSLSVLMHYPSIQRKVHLSWHYLTGLFHPSRCQSSLEYLLVRVPPQSHVQNPLVLQTSDSTIIVELSKVTWLANKRSSISKLSIKLSTVPWVYFELQHLYHHTTVAIAIFLTGNSFSLLPATWMNDTSAAPMSTLHKHGTTAPNNGSLLRGQISPMISKLRFVKRETRRSPFSVESSYFHHFSKLANPPRPTKLGLL